MFFKRKHKFTYQKVYGTGSSSRVPGVLYQCSCGWSQGWIAGTSVRRARRINRVAHKVMWK